MGVDAATFVHSNMRRPPTDDVECYLLADALVQTEYIKLKNKYLDNMGKEARHHAPKCLTRFRTHDAKVTGGGGLRRRPQRLTSTAPP